VRFVSKSGFVVKAKIVHLRQPIDEAGRLGNCGIMKMLGSETDNEGI
jgi:hypothetical protein